MLEGLLPSVFIERTVLYRANAVLPVVTGRKVCTLYDTAARETEEAGMKVIQSLCKIFAETVSVAVPCIHREKRNMFNVYCNRRLEEDAEG